MSSLHTDQKTTADAPWVPDQRDGTFRNPVIYADYSDPDAVRDGDEFFMTASSFNCTPGLPILRSRDLVNWTLINHAVKNLPDPRGVYDTPQSGCGIWAPAIRKHDGKFWIFFPMPDEGIYVTVADHPAAKWSEPWLLVEGKGLIDPCPLWDDDGKAYLVHAYARSRSGIKNKLRVRPMSWDGTKLLGDGQIVFDEPERHPTCEGPKFEKRNGYYYILAPAGGVATGWQLALRSRNVYGPYEEKIVLEQGSTPVNGPHQGALVDTSAGENWFLHFQDVGLYGRIVHLQPVQWVDDWPLMGKMQKNGIGEPVLRYAKPNVGTTSSEVAVPQTSDDFSSDRLGLQWQWNANHDDRWHSLTARSRHMRLYSLGASPSFEAMPNLLLQKFPARAFTAEITIKLDQAAAGVEAGLVVAGKTNAAVAVRSVGGKFEVRQIVNDEVIDTKTITSNTVRFIVKVEDGGNSTFLFAEDGGKPVSVGASFIATEGVWIGARVGIFVRNGNAGDFADFASFKIS